MTTTCSIIIPTRNRCRALAELLHSLRSLRGLRMIHPEVIVGDNASHDQTWTMLQEEATRFPVPLRVLRISRPGKSAVLNETISLSRAEWIAFLDDDVIVEPGWLEGLNCFFHNNAYPVAQGVIRIQSSATVDPETRMLLYRYRTIPNLEYAPEIKEVCSLNGANMAMKREIFSVIGGFDEHLGPGTSGTSEDVELALRIRRRGIRIGYVSSAVVYHRVDRSRLTDSYFHSVHTQQGKSRYLIKKPSTMRVLSNLARVSMFYGLYSLIGKQRRKYRYKGRVYHYLAMLESARNAKVLR